MSDDELTPDEAEEMATLRQRLDPCADFLNMCRAFGGHEPDGESDEERSRIVCDAVAAIVRRVMGNRTWLVDDDMPLVLAGVARRGLELLGEGEVHKSALPDGVE